MELTIARLGSAGDGIAEDGTFVPLALPGERIEAEALKPGRARLTRVLTASPERITPPCPHFGTCGGCALQHWDSAPYAAWKRGLLVDALRRAGFPDAPLAPLAQSPPGSRRRADLAARRTGDGVALGLHARGERAIIDLSTCLLLDPQLVALLAPLRALLARLAAMQREASVVLNLLDSGPDLLLRTDGALTPPDRARLAAFATEHAIPRIAWARGDGAHESAAQLAPVRHALAGVSVSPPPGAFLQATRAGEAAITAAILDALPALPKRALLFDLYAGLGTLSFALATRGRVEAFEGDATAHAALDAAARGSGLKLRATRRDLARQPLTAKELAGAAAIVLDPPYAGAAPQMPALARCDAKLIAYVSCHPAALARDAAALREAGWRLLSATPIDQFPWSPHLESVAVFSRR
jgi:23S rRNA (uracil1939-C5)-methyltransferase